LSLLTIERDFYLYRSYIAQGKFQVPINDIEENSPVPLLAVKAFAQYLHKPQEFRERTLATIRQWMKDTNASNPFVQVFISWSRVFSIE
jgi:coatomer protein complex subunit epsilon